MQACFQVILDDCKLPERWYKIYTENIELRCFEVVRQEFHKPMSVLHLLLVKNDLTWQAENMVPSDCAVLKSFPPTLNREFVPNMVSTICATNTCVGNYDDKFITLRRGRFLSCNGQLVAFLDETLCVEIGGKQYSATIRHVKEM